MMALSCNAGAGAPGTRRPCTGGGRTLAQSSLRGRGSPPQPRASLQLLKTEAAGSWGSGGQAHWRWWAWWWGEDGRGRPLSLASHTSCDTSRGTGRARSEARTRGCGQGRPRTRGRTRRKAGDWSSGRGPPPLRSTGGSASRRSTGSWRPRLAGARPRVWMAAGTWRVSCSKRP